MFRVYACVKKILSVFLVHTLCIVALKASAVTCILEPDDFDSIAEKSIAYKQAYQPFFSKLSQKKSPKNHNQQIMQNLWDNPNLWTLPYCRKWKKGLYALLGHDPESYGSHVLSVLCDATKSEPSVMEKIGNMYLLFKKENYDTSMLTLSNDIYYLQTFSPKNERYHLEEYVKIFSFIKNSPSDYLKGVGLNFSENFRVQIKNYLNIQRLRTLYTYMDHMRIDENTVAFAIQPVFYQVSLGDPVAAFELGRFYLYKGLGLPEHSPFWSSEHNRHHQGLCLLKVAFQTYRSHAWAHRFQGDETCALTYSAANRIFIGEKKPPKARQKNWEGMQEFLPKKKDDSSHPS